MKLSKFKFSVIIPSNSIDGIKKTLNSIIEQTLDFEENVEAIIIGDNFENITKACRTYIDSYPNNVSYISTDSITPEMGLESINGEYFIFLEANDHLSENTLEHTLNFIKNNPQANLITIPIYYYKNNKRENYLDYPVKKSSVYDLKETPEPVQLLGISTFIKKESVNDVKLIIEYNRYITFLSDLLIENPILGICSDGSYYMENIEEKMLPTEEIAFNCEEYERFIENNLNNLIEKSENKFSQIPKFVQYCLLNQIKWISTIENTKENLDLSFMKKIIEYLDDEILINNILMENEKEIEDTSGGFAEGETEISFPEYQSSSDDYFILIEI